MKGRKRDPAWMLISVMMLFFFSAFLLISFQKEQINLQGLLLSVAVPAMILIGTMVLPKLFPADKLLLSFFIGKLRYPRLIKLSVKFFRSIE